MAFLPRRAQLLNGDARRFVGSIVPSCGGTINLRRVEDYGDEAKTRGSYASKWLLSRQLVDSGVRFVQLYHCNSDRPSHSTASLGRRLR